MLLVDAAGVVCHQLSLLGTKQSHAEDHTEHIEATSKEGSCLRTGWL